MPNQDQTVPSGQGTTTGKSQGRCQNFNQTSTSTDQDTSLFGALCRRFRAGGQGQGKGCSSGRGNGAGFRGGCKR